VQALRLPGRALTLAPVLRVEADVAIVGSGFAGSLMALALRRQGRSVVLLERGRHPRFAIGESSTPLANLLIEELADRYDLPRVRRLSKWGTWQRSYPHLACGLKRGFSFFRHERDRPFVDGPEHARQLLVAASPHDRVADTHWYRPHVDEFLAGEAVAAGATLLDETALQGVEWRPEGALLDGTRSGRTLRVRASFLIDASGPRGFLHRALALPEPPLHWLPPTQSLYSHFESVARWDHLVASDAAPPFPIDDAALHHVFDGGWIWVLRFNNGVTSAGAAVTDAVAARLRLADGAAAWDRLLAELPAVRDQFADARPVLPFVRAPRLAFRSAAVCGPRWALLPSAAGVIDPLLSTGFPLTLLGIGRLAEVLERLWDGPGSAGSLGTRLEDPLAAYARQTLLELDATERLVAALYASMTDFELFKRLSLLYFAAASFTETARRLNRPERAPGFLLRDHEAFGPESASCAEEALGRPVGESRRRLLERIDRAIVPFDVAGLGDRARRDWYPVRADDLLAAAPRLGAQEDELHGLLARCGFPPEARRAVSASS
jgi:tetracycline 7-halogenase / FADH2 O2-dependent halogenase